MRTVARDSIVGTRVFSFAMLSIFIKSDTIIKCHSYPNQTFLLLFYIIHLHRSLASFDFLYWNMHVLLILLWLCHWWFSEITKLHFSLSFLVKSLRLQGTFKFSVKLKNCNIIEIALYIRLKWRATSKCQKLATNFSVRQCVNLFLLWGWRDSYNSGKLLSNVCSVWLSLIGNLYLYQWKSSICSCPFSFIYDRFISANTHSMQYHNSFNETPKNIRAVGESGWCCSCVINTVSTALYSW